MTEISRVNLFGKLNEVCYQTIESATVFCKLRTNAYVEIAHWLHQILATQDSDVQHVVQHFALDPGILARDLTSSLDRLPRGASSISDLSTQVEESVERAWLYASLLFGESRVRTGHLLVGWLKTRTLRNTLLATSKEFGKVNVDALTERFQELTARSAEARLSRTASESTASGSEAAGGAVVPAQMGKQEALARYTIDLTERARSGEIDRIVGRDEEIRQLVQILMRRRQNNPILTGEAGVGKTAVVEGFAQRLASGDVPPQLKDVSLRALDLGLLQAGASMKGEFEGRLRQVIDEVQASPKPIILFVDEAHTLIGAGGAQGTGDAANLLKPALARGKLRTIAATTWAEYKKYIEGDPALTRRFQVVKVDEPSEAKAVLMMRGTASALESHHRVQVLDEAIVAAVKLSKRYVPDRQLPDKSVSLLDTACARVAVSQHAVPAELEDSQRRIDALTQELEIIARERSVGVDVEKRANEAQKALDSEQARLGSLQARFQAEKELVDKILALRAKLRSAGVTPPDGFPPEPPLIDSPTNADPLTDLRALEASLLELQGEAPLILPSVTEQAVALVVAEWTGIPTGRMVKNEIEAVLNSSQLLSRRVVGQDHALEMISRRIQTARAGLENPGKPIGVFLLAGPSGVGKTETALALAEGLYGGEQNVITINMSEYQESHSVSTLKGAPPGYVGYGEGGVLTEAVRRRPYSVVLLDEIEKAHPDVHEVFFQVFDKGFMEDGQGTFIDFKNTIILATSNVGSDLIMGLCAGPNRPDAIEITERLRAPMLQVFPAALLGRMVVIPYYPLGDEMLKSIISLQLERVSQRVMERYAVPLDYDQSVVDLVAERCSEVESGGRAIDAVLTNSLLPQVSRELLSFTLQGQPVTRVAVRVANSQFTYSFQ
ncbi:MAG TPA: type VI secretion system ATPase TssH [Polyangiaceae bacterium]|nr:type VI secretion system ATPase TssH [Polyangiaceae bacterium]